MDDPVDPTEASLRLGPDLAHAGEVGGIHPRHEHLRAGGLEGSHAFDPAAGLVLFAVARDPGVPPRALRQTAPPHEDEPRSHRPSEELRDVEADLSQPAGHEVGAALAQAEPLRGGRREPHRLERLHPPPALAEGHHLSGFARQALVCEEIQGLVVEAVASRGAHVHAAGRDPGVLLRGHLRDREDAEPIRAHRLSARHLMQVAREQDEPQRLPRSPAAERLEQEERAQEAALLLPREPLRRRRGHLQRRRAPRVHHAARAPPLIVQLPDESTVVLGRAGSQGEALLGFPFQASAGPHEDHSPPGAAQPLGERACRTPLLAQDQPAADGGLRAFRFAEALGDRRPPRGQGKPRPHVRSLGDGGARARGSRLDPVALPLEGVGGQGDPAAPRRAVYASPTPPPPPTPTPVPAP